MLYHVLDSLVGPLLLRADSSGLCALDFLDGDFVAPVGWRHDAGALAPWTRDLEAYFSGSRPAFDAPLSMKGTAFQLEVWQALRRIPYGTTISYGGLASRIGNPKAVRAVGLANGRNPIPIIVPCHRVIGADGTLTGYGGGLDRKRALLRLEGLDA